MSIFKRYFDCRNGASSLEFALVINAFIVFVVGAIGLSNYYSIKSDLRESMLNAERYALIHDEDDATLQDLMKSNLATYDPAALQFSFLRAANGGVDFIKVNVSYNVDFIFGIYPISETRVFPT